MNTFARISITSYFIALVSAIPTFLFTSETSSINIISGAVAFISAIISVGTGVISLANREQNKLFPTISLSSAFICIYLLGLGLMSVMFPNDPIVTKGTLTNFGIFEFPKQENDTLKNKYQIAFRYLQLNTDSIPAQKGVNFGFNYVISGEPEFGFVDIMKIIKYPEPGKKINNKHVHSDSTLVSVSINEIVYTGIEIDNESEQLPGKWEIEFSHNSRKLFSKVFTLYKID